MKKNYEDLLLANKTPLIYPGYTSRLPLISEPVTALKNRIFNYK